MNEFFCKRVGYNTFDIFQGKQWGSWSRIRAGRNGVYVARGLPLPHALVKALAEQVNPRLSEQHVVV